jgi:alpha/beta superfamily hydrolase
MLREIEGPAGRLEARFDAPEGQARGVAVVASPHPELGGTLNDRVVYHAAQGLKRAGFAVMRFNFRGAGTSDGKFSGGPGELDDFRAAVAAAVTHVPDVPVWAVGYSFGAWVALTAGAADARIETLVGIAPVVTGYDFEPVRQSGKATFLVHGERDEIAPLKAVQRFYGTLDEPRELIVIDAADHVFDGHASEVADALEDLAR